MDPNQPQPEGEAGPTVIPPSFSPLHPPSVQHNTQILSNISTLSAVFSGTLAGILGLLNFNGFILYFVASAFTAGVVAVLKCTNGRGQVDLKRVLPTLHDGKIRGKGGMGVLRQRLKEGWTLMAVGQENLLTYLLFWIGFYVSAVISRRCHACAHGSPVRHAGHHSWYVLWCIFTHCKACC